MAVCGSAGTWVTILRSPCRRLLGHRQRWALPGQAALGDDAGADATGGGVVVAAHRSFEESPGAVVAGAGEVPEHVGQGNPGGAVGGDVPGFVVQEAEQLVRGVLDRAVRARVEEEPAVAQVQQEHLVAAYLHGVAVGDRDDVRGEQFGEQGRAEPDPEGEVLEL